MSIRGTAAYEGLGDLPDVVDPDAGVGGAPGDFTPMTGWSAIHPDEPDRPRLHWLHHPALLATEVRLAPDLASIVGIRVR